jgi:hypothetical protein
MTRYWAIRTDQARRPFFWRELQAGRLRQGWGYREELDLENLARLRRKGAKLAKYQQDAWRGNRRLLQTEPDSMQTGDIVVFLHLPDYGTWSIARVTGGYRFEISDEPNNVDGTPDYGHVRPVELLTGDRPIRPVADRVSDGLRRSMRPIMRMWSLDTNAQELDRVLHTRTRKARVVSVTFVTATQPKGRGRFSIPKRITDLLDIGPGADVRIEVTSKAGHFGPVVKTLKSDREPSPAGDMAEWMESGEFITVIVSRA